MKISPLKNKRLLTLIVLFIVSGLFFSLTNPDKINSLVLIAGFVLVSILFYVIIESLLYLLVKSGLHSLHIKRVAAFLAVLIGVLLALQSIGQLSVRDVLVILPLWLLLYVYLTYIKPRSKN